MGQVPPAMSSNQKVLVVEDEEHVAELITLYLDKAGYTTEVVADGPEALPAVRRFGPQLVILDLMLPGMDGLEVCRQIRKESRVPIIMLTAKAEEVDRVVGLELGADDYVVKPFSPRELVARVKAVLRRTGEPEERGDASYRLEVPGLRMDQETHQAWVGETELSLTPMEFKLLWYLAAHPRRVCSREELLERVWGYDSYSDARTVDVHVKRVRGKLEEAGAAAAKIATVWGLGYKFEAG